MEPTKSIADVVNDSSFDVDSRLDELVRMMAV